VECLKWGGEGLLYSASRDRTIKVWAVEGKQVGLLVRTLVGHAHRINTLALNVDYVCRTGPYDHTFKIFETREDMQKAAQVSFTIIADRNINGPVLFTPPGSL
jgi:ribosome assembly protein 4